MRRLLPALNALFAVLFLFGAAVQYNDPDPARWIAIYLAAAIVSALAALGRASRVTALVVGGVALAWALTLVPRVWGRVRAPELVADWEMKDERVEEGREMYGLLIIVAAMGLASVRAGGPRKDNS